MWVQSLGWEDPLEKERATLSSILAWEIPWAEEPDRLQSMGWQRVKCDWACTHTHTHTLSLFYRWGNWGIERLVSENTGYKWLSQDMDLGLSDSRSVFLTSTLCCAVLCLVTQSCPTLCDLMSCSLPGSSVHGDSPGKSTGMGRHALLQLITILPAQKLKFLLLVSGGKTFYGVKTYIQPVLQTLSANFKL